MKTALRPSQTALIDHCLTHGGKMGVSAVPGSGKTFTLSYLAARLVVEKIEPGQEVLIVTLVNSAVDNFRQRINGLIGEMGLLPGMGYRVRTLHGLAHDIVRQRTSLMGLADDFSVLDERECAQAFVEAVNRWIERHPIHDRYVNPALLSGRSADRVKNEGWPALVLETTRSLVKRAKDVRLGPTELGVRAAAEAQVLPLVDMAAEIYADYQASLSARGGVDFDDLIRYAYRILELDQGLLSRLRNEWPFILEDEAQDSSRSQEDILRLLTHFPEANWVRVGDPNQSIFNTFTNSSPEYLRAFLNEEGVARFELPVSGRSQPSIIGLANHLIDWAGQHAAPHVQRALSRPHVFPAPPDDPQPNPADNPQAVKCVNKAFTPREEIEAIVRSLGKWAEGPRAESVAILVASNRRGAQFSEALKSTGLPVAELLDTTPETRSTAGTLGNALQHLADPTSSRQLATLFHAWNRHVWTDPCAKGGLHESKTGLASLLEVERFLWPLEAFDVDSIPSPAPSGDDVERAKARLGEFRTMLRRWHQAASLPIDQLILYVAPDLFSEPAGLALAHKLAAELKHSQRLHPTWRLPELVGELASIARNERRFVGFTDETYKPKPGEVTIATIHRAKGLEWDRVYLTSVNNYDFPMGDDGDSFISEKWFVRDRLNVPAEALAQLETLLAEDAPPYGEGAATRKARDDYVAERLRLLYVAITRAKKELIVTWNLGRGADDPGPINRQPLRQAGAFIELSRWMDERQTTAAS